MDSNSLPSDLRANKEPGTGMTIWGCLWVRERWQRRDGKREKKNKKPGARSLVPLLIHFVRSFICWFNRDLFSPSCEVATIPVRSRRVSSGQTCLMEFVFLWGVENERQNQLYFLIYFVRQSPRMSVVEGRVQQEEQGPWSRDSWVWVLAVRLWGVA